jgi:DNA polymerase alpha subunit B
MILLTRYFQVVNSVLCINPGTLSKKRGAGTFASLNVQPKALSDEKRETGEPLANSVFERARVDVVRI